MCWDVHHVLLLVVLILTRSALCQDDVVEQTVAYTRELKLNRRLAGSDPGSCAAHDCIALGRSKVGHRRRRIHCLPSCLVDECCGEVAHCEVSTANTSGVPLVPFTTVAASTTVPMTTVADSTSFPMTTVADSTTTMPSTTLMTAQATTTYVLLTSGSCQTYITSVAECATAAQQVGLADTTVSDDGQSGVDFDPPFCYFEGSSLKYNSNGQNTGSCSSSDNCLCRVEATTTMAATTADCGNEELHNHQCGLINGETVTCGKSRCCSSGGWCGTGSSYCGFGSQTLYSDGNCEGRFTILQSGTCEDVGRLAITRIADCNAAAKALQLADTFAQEITSTPRPYGCIILRDRSWLGFYSNTANQGNGAGTWSQVSSSQQVDLICGHAEARLLTQAGCTEPDTPSWQPVASTACPCTETDQDGCDLPECASTMASGQLCEADEALPDGRQIYDINNCPGSFDVFVMGCSAPWNKACSMTNPQTSTRFSTVPQFGITNALSLESCMERCVSDTSCWGISWKFPSGSRNFEGTCYLTYSKQPVAYSGDSSYDSWEKTCDSVCGSLYPRKSNNGSIQCEYSPCSKIDCCGTTAQCDSFTCPLGFYSYEYTDGNQVHRRRRYCVGSTCTNSECCVGSQSTCASFTCPADQVLKASTLLQLCAGSDCATKCCIAGNDLSSTSESSTPATGGSSCPNFNAGNCPAGWKGGLASGAVLCATVQCRWDECCIASPYCNTISCAVGELRPDAASVRCSGSTCTQAECCMDQANCDSWVCDHKQSLAPQSRRRRLVCPGSCTVSYCCGQERTCESSMENGQTDFGTSCGANLLVQDYTLTNTTCPSGYALRTDWTLASCQAFASYAHWQDSTYISGASVAGCAVKTPDFGATSVDYSVKVYYGSASTTSQSEYHSICWRDRPCSESLCARDECCVSPSFSPGPECSAGICKNSILETTSGIRRRRSCRGRQCTEWECCRQAPFCSTYTCPSTDYVDKTGKANIQCAHAPCTAEECCDSKERCDDISCTSGFAAVSHRRRRITCSTSRCTLFECCWYPITCGVYTGCDYENGYYLKPDAESITCSGATCTTSECCLSRGLCHNNGSICNSGYEDRSHRRRRLMCATSTCTTADCCTKEDTCEEHSCGEGVIKATAVDISCSTVRRRRAYPDCSDSRCCDTGSPAVCNGTCVGQLVLNVPTEHRRRRVSCAGSTCTVQECCQQAQGCLATTESVVCQTSSSEAWIYKPDYATQRCAGAVCTTAECCVRRATCDTYQCSQGSVPVADRRRRVTCASSTCLASECCGQPGTCNAVSCNRRRSSITQKNDAARWWRIRNLGYIGTSLEVTDFRMYSDTAMTQELHSSQVISSSGSATSSSNNGIAWTFQVSEALPGQAWIGMSFSTETAVKAAKAIGLGIGSGWNGGVDLQRSSDGTSWATAAQRTNSNNITVEACASTVCTETDCCASTDCSSFTCSGLNHVPPTVARSGSPTCGSTVCDSSECCLEYMSCKAASYERLDLCEHSNLVLPNKYCNGVSATDCTSSTCCDTMGLCSTTSCREGWSMKNDTVHRRRRQRCYANVCTPSLCCVENSQQAVITYISGALQLQVPQATLTATTNCGNEQLHNHMCGPISGGAVICGSSRCCSKNGWCGSGSSYCDGNQQALYSDGNCEASTANRQFEDAIKNGIAAMTSLDPTWISVTLSTWTRRLHLTTDERKLQLAALERRLSSSSLKAQFTITIPSTAPADVTPASVQANMLTKNAQTAITASIAVAGLSSTYQIQAAYVNGGSTGFGVQTQGIGGVAAPGTIPSAGIGGVAAPGTIPSAGSTMTAGFAASADDGGSVSIWGFVFAALSIGAVPLVAFLAFYLYRKLRGQLASGSLARVVPISVSPSIFGGLNTPEAALIDEAERHKGKRLAREHEDNLPKYWNNKKIREEQTYCVDGGFDSMAYVSRDLHKEFDELLAMTYVSKVTQDRPCPKKSGGCGKVKGGCPCNQPGGDPGLPTEYRVRRIIRVEDSDMWGRYVEKKAAICKARDLTSIWHPNPPVVSDDISGKYPETFEALDSDCNEVYLWHGTFVRNALSIAQNDFRIDMAGSGAGSMYGPGAYFGENSTKADEYAKDEPGGYYDGIYCLLLCRVVLGKYYYTGDRDDKAGDKVTSGEFDSVLGDRVKTANTFREFVIFDNDQVYPEYIVLYSRVHSADSGDLVEAALRQPFHMELPVYWRSFHRNPRVDPFHEQYLVLPHVKDQIQQLVSACLKDGDAKVKRVRRIENSTIWNAYVNFKMELGVEMLKKDKHTAGYSDTAARFRMARTRCTPVRELDGNPDSGRVITDAAINNCDIDAVITIENLESDMNELFLWHGTSRAAAEAIVKSDFRIPKTGAAHGSRFGHGAYFAEQLDKSLSYCTADDDGTKIILLCRVCCGEIYYTEAGSETDADSAARRAKKTAVVANPGGTEPREFIVLDAKQVYPEFLCEVTC